MKFSFNRALALFVVSAVSLLAATSCSKSNNNGSSAGMSASIGSTAWANTVPLAGIYSTAGGTFEIGGAQYKGGDSSLFAVAFTSPVTLNKALVSDGTTVDVGYIHANSSTTAIYDGSPFSGGAAHSIVTVTSYDSTGHKVSGTFSGVLYNEQNANDSIIITNGKFSSTFTVQ